MKKNSANNFVLDIRDQRVTGGRLTLSTRTGKRPDARRREAAVRGVLDAGHLDLIERLRDRSDPLRIDDLTRAWEDGDMERLRQRSGLAPLRLGDTADAWLADVRANYAPETHRQYDIVLTMARAKFGDEADPAALSPEQWREWLNESKATAGDREWSHNRRTLAYAAVNRFYNELLADEDHRSHRLGVPARIARNPLDRVATPRYVATRVEFLRPEEWRVLAAKVEGTPLAAFVALGCLAGLRIGEAAHLRTGIDVVLDGDRPRLEIQPRKGEHAWVPKGYPRHSRSVRTIPLGSFPALLHTLTEHQRLGYAGDAYFIRLAGRDRPLARQTLAKWTKEAFTAAGIRYGREKDALTFHSLRHSFISWLVQADYSLLKIEKLAGTSVRMIQEVYSHLIDEDLDRGMALLEQKVTGG